VLIGFLVGLAISSKTFYSLVLENIRNRGVLKAMGASDQPLSRVIMLYTLTVGLIGYDCGVGLATMLGSACLHKGMPSLFMPWQLPAISLVAILFICWLATSLGIRKNRSLEPAIVFQG
jgi:putative ABC transport system permease protein